MPPTSSKPDLFVDFDGTVVDALGPDYELYRQSLAPVHPLPRGEFIRLRRARTPLPDLLALTPGAHLEDFLRRRRERAESPDILGAATLLPGARAALRSLSLRYACHLVSARADRALLVRQCDELDVSPFLSSVSAVRAPEGKRDVFRAHAGRPGAWVIGDTEHDIHAAEACGLPVIAVASGIRSRAFLAGVKPTRLMEDIAEAAHFLLNEDPNRPA